MTLNAAKLYGPKQVGALYVRRGTKLAPLLAGGGQEGGLRPGSENVAGVVGFARALSDAQAMRAAEGQRLAQLQQQILAGLAQLPGWQLNGHPQQRLASNLNISIDGVEGEELVLHLDREGIMAATGAACSAGSDQPSHVLLALGLSPRQANASLRLSLGRPTIQAEVERLLSVLPTVVERLRGQVK